MALVPDLGTLAKVGEAALTVMRDSHACLLHKWPVIPIGPSWPGMLPLLRKAATLGSHTHMIHTIWSSVMDLGQCGGTGQQASNKPFTMRYTAEYMTPDLYLELMVLRLLTWP